MSTETPEWVKKLEARMDSLELSSSNLAESMSAIDELSKVVSKIANLPSDEEVKLSKKESAIKLKSNTREERLKFFSKK
jgi:antitoxin component HigA of HigAB toxin-antitoxin module